MEEVLHFPLCQNGSFYDRPIFLLFFGLSSLTKYEDFQGVNGAWELVQSTMNHNTSYKVKDKNERAYQEDMFNTFNIGVEQNAKKLVGDNDFGVNSEFFSFGVEAKKKMVSLSTKSNKIVQRTIQLNLNFI